MQALELDRLNPILFTHQFDQFVIDKSTDLRILIVFAH